MTISCNFYETAAGTSGQLWSLLESALSLENLDELCVVRKNKKANNMEGSEIRSANSFCQCECCTRELCHLCNFANHFRRFSSIKVHLPRSQAIQSEMRASENLPGKLTVKNHIKQLSTVLQVREEEIRGALQGDYMYLKVW